MIFPYPHLNSEEIVLCLPLIFSWLNPSKHTSYLCKPASAHLSKTCYFLSQCVDQKSQGLQRPLMASIDFTL